MTREEAIQWLTNEKWTNANNKYKKEWNEAFDMAIEALQADAVKRVDCSNFLLWLLEEIMDEDNWEFNAVADGEIIARKLKKLGLLEVKDGYYHRIFDENVWIVRCKDCKWADKAIFDEYCVECTMHHTTFMKHGFCNHGERREPTE